MNNENNKKQEFNASQAWGAQDIANMNGITTHLHWTDKPYKWRINEGSEVFVILNDKEDKLEKSTILNVGDIFYASVGTEYVAHPRGEARILVVESEGSV